MNTVYRYTHHALSRMESRKVSAAKVAQIISCGQIFLTKKGLFKAKVWEHYGKTVEKYAVVFSKSDHVVVTVEHSLSPCKSNSPESDSFFRQRKIHRMRKRAAREQEFDSYCREEYEYYNLKFSA